MPAEFKLEGPHPETLDGSHEPKRTFLKRKGEEKSSEPSQEKEPLSFPEDSKRKLIFEDEVTIKVKPRKVAKTIAKVAFMVLLLMGAFLVGRFTAESDLGGITAAFVSVDAPEPAAEQPVQEVAEPVPEQESSQAEQQEPESLTQES